MMQMTYAPPPGMQIAPGMPMMYMADPNMMAAMAGFNPNAAAPVQSGN